MDPVASTPSAKSLTTQAFEQLRADILGGALRPSERLRIQSLSERYQVGPTAIREALSRLVPEGLVESEEQRGFCVAAVSREELMDLTTTRVAIEGLALSQALEKGGVAWESRLLSAYHLLSRTPAPTDEARHGPWAVAHRAFHEALVDGCGSPWMLRVCGLLYDKSERYRNLAEIYTRPKGRDTFNEHRELMEAAMARDIAKVQQLLHGHYWETTEIVLATSPVLQPAAPRGPGRGRRPASASA
jgi:DNA-binding GntR family transcriptional regulator